MRSRLIRFALVVMALMFAATQTASGSCASFSFGYDTSNRLIRQQASDAGWWSYPATAGATGYTALSQYSAVGSVSPSYDGNGDLTYDGTFTYAYDAERRLTSIVQGGATLSAINWITQ